MADRRATLLLVESFHGPRRRRIPFTPSGVVRQICGNSARYAHLPRKEVPISFLPPSPPRSQNHFSRPTDLRSSLGSSLTLRRASEQTGDDEPLGHRDSSFSSFEPFTKKVRTTNSTSVRGSKRNRCCRLESHGEGGGKLIRRLPHCCITAA
eukprot:CCRYP_020842-RA/>CCRYP_020842-RA protein AED:0.37 eAED:0.37 QI:0/0/0/1/0/0/2/0/151